MYITPLRVPTMGLGVDLSNVSPLAIRSACLRSSATIDAVCAVPRLPQKHDFRGGVITKERHDWILDPDARPRPNRVYLNHEPVVSVERLEIFATNTQKVSIDTSELVINQSGGYVEISSLLLTQYGVFGAGIVPYIGLYHPVIEVDYTYRREFEVVDEEAEFVDGQSYQLQNQFWLVSAPVEVKVDGVVKTVTTDYTINWTEGRIVFTANQPADAVVEVSYTYTLPHEIHQAAGLLVAEELGEADVRQSGLTGLDSLRVVQGGGASVEKTREGSRRGVKTMSDLPWEISQLLNGYVFLTVR